MLGIALVAVQAAVLTVGPGAGFSRVSDALERAGIGDTIRVRAGVYHDRPVIRTSVTIIGEPGAILDGDGQHAVITVLRPAIIRGLTIRGTGSNQAREDAGILVENAMGSVFEDNVLVDVLFGIYVKQSDSVVIRRNRIEGKNVAASLRGDGIRLWQSHHGIIDGNDVRRSRDVVIWFSNGTVIRNNRVSDSRYGLHYMYSDDNYFETNEFTGNSVGAFIMYSTNVTFRNNLFADARGTAGRGLGFKDAEGITAIHNTLVKNAVGISFDNSPFSANATNEFRENVIAFNDVGITMLPSVQRNRFEENAFINNVLPVRVSGGGTAVRNVFAANYWSDYAGFDRDGDDRGDAAFVFERLSDDVLAKHEPLQLYTLSPAVSALDMLSRVLPLLQPEPLVIDSAPAITDHAKRPSPSGSPLWAVFFLVPAAGALTVASRFRRVRPR